MSQIIDPSYNARMNTEKEKFGVVFHAPELPDPSSVYANYVCFLSTDGCFYECHLDGETYVWEKQTFGPKRQFIISVTWLVQGSDGYSFNDEVDTIKRIVTEMKKYDSYFESLEAEYPTLETSTMNLIEACSITDKLIDYVNKNCDANLSNIDIDTDGMSTSDYVNPPSATCEQLATYLNEVIGILNPHAGFSVLTKEVEALREIISGRTEEYTELTKTQVREFLERHANYASHGVQNPPLEYKDGIYYSAMPDEAGFEVITSEEDLRWNEEVLEWTFIYRGPENLYISQDGEDIRKFEFGTDNFTFWNQHFYLKVENVSVVTPADFNLLRNTFNQFSSDQKVANDKFRTSINALNTALTEVKNAIGATGLKGDIDKIIGTYLGITPSDWTRETKSFAARIEELTKSITDTTVEGSIAKSVKAISDILSGPNGNNGLVSTVVALNQAINATGTGLKAVVGDSSGGLVKAVNEIATKVSELESNSGASKIRSIDDKLSLAKDAFSEIADMFTSIPRVYTKTEDSAPVAGKRYWTREVTHVSVVNPDLTDGNDYFLYENGIYTQIDSNYSVTPGVDLNCYKAIYKYTLAKNVESEGFSRGVLYYESNLSQDDLANAVWTIIEKSADVVAALEDKEEEPENQGD